MDTRKDIKNVLTENYMPYAKSTIMDRAICQIDGFKPSTRRIPYMMYTMGLISGQRTKAANIVGQTMRLHPHGDQTIYSTMVRMVGSNGSLNVPYIEGKGNYGKVYSKGIQPAASRYTEAKLAPIAKELFDGINEDAVNMVDNFDSTMKEPEILPVKFPTILVNNSDGIAVGLSSNIPTFGLREVCEATIGIINGTITNVSELMEVLGPPEFPTGGYIHCDEKELYKLGAKGAGTFTVSGRVECYQNKIVIREIPYGTTIERIIEDVKNNMKTELKEVDSISNLTDINGLRIDVNLKRGANPKAVLKKLCRLTNVRMKMSFRTAVIINGEYPKTDLTLLELIQEWISFRIRCIQRVYTTRLRKKTEQEHILESWEKIANNLQEVAEMLPKYTEAKLKELLIERFNLEDDQAEYIMDMRGRDFTTDKFNKRMIELKKVRSDIQEYQDILSNQSRTNQIIVSELTDIKDKYGHERLTKIADPIVEVEDEPEQVDDTVVSVVVTKNGFIKRLVSLRDETNFQPDEGDSVWCRFSARNNEQVLVFTYSGACYKINVNSIDASRGRTKDYIPNMIERFDTSDILYVAPAKNYTGGFNVVYSNGRGMRVRFDKVAGNRSRYKSAFIGGEPGTIWVTGKDKFFIITNRKCAAYIDLELLNRLSTRSAFKVGRILSGDSIFGLQPASKVPNFDSIDIEPYTKGYCVKIKDQLW